MGGGRRAELSSGGVRIVIRRSLEQQKKVLQTHPPSLFSSTLLSTLFVYISTLSRRNKNLPVKPQRSLATRLACRPTSPFSRPSSPPPFSPSTTMSSSSFTIKIAYGQLIRKISINDGTFPSFTRFSEKVSFLPSSLPPLACLIADVRSTSSPSSFPSYRFDPSSTSLLTFRSPLRGSSTLPTDQVRSFSPARSSQTSSGRTLSLNGVSTGNRSLRRVRCE